MGEAVETGPPAIFEPHRQPHPLSNPPRSFARPSPKKEGPSTNPFFVADGVSADKRHKLLEHKNNISGGES